MAKSKKGISPLIATVLILGFTVALAAVIMTWGTKFTRDVQKSTGDSAEANVACAQDVVLNVQGACRDGVTNDYKITVANDGTAGIKKLNVRLYASGSQVDTDERDTTTSLTSFKISPITATAATYAGSIKRVDLIPTIEVSGSSVTCSSNIVSYGDVSGSPFGAC